MASRLDHLPHVHPESRAEWRAWLDEHHASESGAWLVTWRKASGRTGLPYDDAVEEALCFGWIDSTGGKVDEHRSKLLFTPRKATSGWARSNKERVARLVDAGLMAPAGLAAVERAKANGTWTILDDVEDLIVPADLQAALEGEPGALDHWEGFSPSSRKQLLWWVVSAKRPETRARRVAEVARQAGQGLNANEYVPKDKRPNASPDRGAST